MEDILAEAKRVAEEAELFAVSSEETQVHFETNRLKHIQTKQSSSLALRIIKEGRIGFALTTDPESRDLISSAVETARFGMLAKFDLPALTSFSPVDTYDSSVKSVSLPEMVRLGNELVATIISHTPDLICEAGINRATISVSVTNSRGGRASYTKSVFSLGIEGTLIRDTDMLFVGDSESSCHPLTDFKPVAREVIRQLELARNQASTPSHELPVIFTPNGVASALITSLIAGFNGKIVLEGASPLGNRLDQMVFDPKLSLWDDPTIPYQPQSRICDDEGVPSQRTPLIERGKVASFLYDLQTAALANTRSTGSASRGRNGLPSPAPSAFVIAPGDTTFDKMVEDVKEGLVIEQLLGAEQGNILGGDFSGNILLGYKIEDGKIVGRVKNTMVTGNVYQVLREIIAIGSEARWVSGFLRTPPIYCPRLSVASK